jgi:hypothetical protein
VGHLNKLENFSRYMPRKRLDGTIHVLAAAVKNINIAMENKRLICYEKN